MLTESIRKHIVQLQESYPEQRSALIPALHIVQKEYGCLSEELQQEVANLFNIALNEVKAVVSFYDMFHEQPLRGEPLRICKNLSCMLRGCDALIQQIKQEVEHSPELNVEIEECECLGACDRAPMVIFKEEVHGPITHLDQLKTILGSTHG